MWESNPQSSHKQRQCNQLTALCCKICFVKSVLCHFFFVAVIILFYSEQSIFHRIVLLSFNRKINGDTSRGRFSCFSLIFRLLQLKIWQTEKEKEKN